MNEVQSFLLEGHGIRGAVVRLRETWLQLIAQHNYHERVIGLLGEALAATVLLGNGLKDKPRISIQIHSDGPVGLLLIQCSEDLRVRGMAQCGSINEHRPLLGAGRLAVNVDTGKTNGFFQGIVPLSGTSFSDCLEGYFAQSEQLPTRLMLYASRGRAAGLMLQMLPGHDEDTAEFATAAELAAAVSEQRLCTMPCETLLPELFDDYQIRLFKPRPVLHDCRCTPEYLARIARMLGSEELESLLAEQGRVSLTCEFCNRDFRFSPQDVQAILRGGTPEPALH